MAHNLTIRQDGTAEMFSGNNETPWHKLGKVVAGMLTANEALKEAQMDWKVKLEPIYSMVNGKPIESNRHKGVVRTDNQKLLEIVGNRYMPIQNVGAFDFFDKIVGEGQAVYETAGSLDEGRKIWIMAKLKGDLFLRSNPKDVTEKRVLLVNSHDGSSSLMIQHVAVRVVCQNTLSAAMKGLSNQIKIRHTANYENKVGEAQKVLQLIHGYYDDLNAIINSLAETSMNQKEMENFVGVLIPSEEETTRATNIRGTMVDLFRNGTGNNGKTRYDALNAVTEYVDSHRATRSSNDNEGENRFKSALMGSGNALKNKALQLLTA